jgi:hypothetical protein
MINHSSSANNWLLIIFIVIDGDEVSIYDKSIALNKKLETSAADQFFIA